MEDEKCIQKLFANPKGIRPLERSRRRWKGNIRMDLRRQGVKVWTGFIWIRTGTSGGLL
jgi:hypothetical protein